MWIKPKPTLHRNTLWKSVEENAHFEILRHITSQNTLNIFSDLVSTVRSLRNNPNDDSEPAPAEVCLPNVTIHFLTYGIA